MGLFLVRMPAASRSLGKFGDFVAKIPTGQRMTQPWDVGGLYVARKPYGAAVRGAMHL